MTQTYTIAITDGGSMPIDIKINLTFKEALKETLSHLEDQDITQICNLYAISTKDHETALNRIQEITIKNIFDNTNLTISTCNLCVAVFKSLDTSRAIC